MSETNSTPAGRSARHRSPEEEAPALARPYIAADGTLVVPRRKTASTPPDAPTHPSPPTSGRSGTVYGGPAPQPRPPLPQRIPGPPVGAPPAPPTSHPPPPQRAPGGPPETSSPRQAAPTKPPGGGRRRRPESEPETPASSLPVQHQAAGPTPTPDQTILMGRVVDLPGGIPVTPEGLEDSAPTPKGVRVVRLRAVRTEEGYKSVYSDLTRTTKASVVRAIVRGTGELFITFGLILLLFAAYEVWGKSAIVNAHQNDLDRQLAQDWEQIPAGPTPSRGALEGNPDVKPPPGNAIARLYLPRLGKQWVVVEGVAPDDINYAPGHYPQTAKPGSVGNFSVAGHRTPAIFWDLDQMRGGDQVVVETRTAWYVYEVYKMEIVKPTALEVVAPVPPGGTKGGSYLTITTCNPKWDNYQRLVLHAALAESRTRAQGKPAVLGG